MKTSIMLAALGLAGCGTINSQYAAVLSNAGSDYTQVKKNLQSTDDMKLQAWIDTACAVNVGALQRAASSTGNSNATRAVLTACPVPSVGVIEPTATGQMLMQTTAIPVAAPSPITQATPAPITPTVAAVLPPQPSVRKAVKKPVAQRQPTASVTLPQPTPTATTPVVAASKPTQSGLLPSGALP